jgi:hypothetical protein
MVQYDTFLQGEGEMAKTITQAISVEIVEAKLQQSTRHCYI